MCNPLESANVRSVRTQLRSLTYSYYFIFLPLPSIGQSFSYRMLELRSGYLRKASTPSLYQVFINYSILRFTWMTYLRQNHLLNKNNLLLQRTHVIFLLTTVIGKRIISRLKLLKNEEEICRLAFIVTNGNFGNTLSLFFVVHSSTWICMR